MVPIPLAIDVELQETCIRQTIEQNMTAVRPYMTEEAWVEVLAEKEISKKKH
jgi:hypothetical protein